MIWILTKLKKATWLGVFFLVLNLSPDVSQAETSQYTCPMHPHYISHSFGSCPICGMDLVEIEAKDIDPKKEQGLHLPLEMIQHTGVRSKTVETAHFGRSIRSFGEVVVNQRLQSDISLRVEGWIEQLKVSAEGDEVKRDSLLFCVYSPQLVTAQQDFLAALATKDRGRIQVTKERLRFLGVQEQVVAKIRREKRVIRNLPYYADHGGRVENIVVRQGSYLRPGSVAMRIQGYETVWVQVNLAEQDIGFIKKNSRVDVQFPSLGLEKREVKIDYIAPRVDPATRTAQLRLVLDNSERILRPGSYVDVRIMTDIEPRLATPTESILENKQGQYVILQKEDGSFQAREIKTGLRYGGLTEVKAGLTEGEEVLVSGQFLIDSESSLRESFRRMEKLSLSLAEQEISDQQLVLLNHLVEGALYIHEELLAGNHPQPQMLDAAVLAADKLEHELQGSRLAYVVEDFAAAMDDRAKIITTSGWQKLLAEATASLLPWINEGRPNYYKDLGLTLFTTEDQRSWIQFAGQPANPYGSLQAREHPPGTAQEPAGE